MGAEGVGAMVRDSGYFARVEGEVSGYAKGGTKNFQYKNRKYLCGLQRYVK